MKTLAVIENELFKDYVKIVATDDLEKTLDNPDVPVPFTCLKSVDNNNADALASHLATFFQSSKVKNKEFYILNPESETQLNFMFDLIQLSSGGVITQPVASTMASDLLSDLDLPKKSTEALKSIVITPTEQITPFEKPLSAVFIDAPVVKSEVEVTVPQVEALVEEEPITVSDFDSEAPKVESFVDNIAEDDEEEDPFKFTPTETKVEPVVEVVTETVEEVQSTDTQESTIFGIPTNSTLNFFKNDTIVATLLSDTTVNFNGDTLTFNEAAKAAFKKAGSLGVANGLSNWLHNGKTLKELKEKNA